MFVLMKIKKTGCGGCTTWPLKSRSNEQVSNKLVCLGFFLLKSSIKIVAMYKVICVKSMTSAATRLTARSSILVARNLSLSAIKYDPEAPQNKLDEILPRVEDFPSHHIGPGKLEAKVMLQELGYNVIMAGFSYV